MRRPSYSVFDRWVGDGLMDVLEQNRTGCVAFSPLYQSLLTDKYLKGIPDGSRTSKSIYFKTSDITEDKIEKVVRLNKIAVNIGQKMSQLALAWELRDPRVTSVIFGASKVSQIEDAVRIQSNLTLSTEELREIESNLKS